MLGCRPYFVLVRLRCRCRATLRDCETVYIYILYGYNNLFSYSFQYLHFFWYDLHFVSSFAFLRNVNIQIDNGVRRVPTIVPQNQRVRLFKIFAQSAKGK